MEKSLSLYLTYDDNIYKVWTVTFNVDEKGVEKINQFFPVHLLSSGGGCSTRSKALRMLSEAENVKITHKLDSQISPAW